MSKLDQKSIPKIQFDSNKSLRLRHIYGVLYFMKYGNDYTEAVKATLRLFPEVKDVQTIADKCTRGFAGDTATFKQWYNSGEILYRLKQILNLSENDYNIFKNLIENTDEQKPILKDIYQVSDTTKDKIERKIINQKAQKAERPVIGVNEKVFFDGNEYRWDGRQWLSVENNTTIPLNIQQILNRKFVPVKNSGSLAINSRQKRINTQKKYLDEKTASPSVTQWSSKIPELERYKFSTWKQVCDHLKINVGSDSARRRLKKWVEENKPRWFQVPEVSSDN